MPKKIHVHLHDRSSPAGRAAFNKDLAQRVGVRDGDSDGEGRWVTINGAHVMIGGDGKITKGPAALVGKSEHQAHAHAHGQAGAEHARAARDKGAKHPDAKYHEAASREHYSATMQYGHAHAAAEAGDIKKAKGHVAQAQKHVAAAAEQEKTLAAPAQPAAKKEAPFAPPKAHEVLHEEASGDVKGSEKHVAEHNRLLNLYHTSKADWERTAVNRLVQKNATDAVQQKAQRLHHTALAASEHAKLTGKPEDHHVASQHIQNAILAHGHAGGVGYAKKQEELAKMKKGHDAEVGKAAKAQPAAPMSHDGTVRKHKAEGDAQEDVGRRGADIKERGFVHQKTDATEPGRTVHHYAHPDGSTAALIHQKVDNGYEPPRHEVSSLVNTMNQGKKGAYPGKGNAYINDPSKPLPRRSTPIAGDQRQDFARAQKASTPALDQIAKRVGKKAEKAVDQDPEHQE